MTAPGTGRERSAWIDRTCIVLAVMLAGAAPMAGQIQSPGLDTFDLRITAELRSMDSRAAEIFIRANEARYKGDLRTAEAGYREVLTRTPAFVHARRRLCDVLVRQGRRSEGIAECRVALAKTDSRENRAALLFALVQETENAKMTGSEQTEVRQRSQQILDAGGNEFELVTTCQAALALDDREMLGRCVGRLDAVAPGGLPTNYFATILAATNGDWNGAEARLRRAEAAGLAPEEAARIRQALDEHRPRWPGYARLAGTVAAGWAAGLLLLLGAGALLSRTALRAAPRVAASRQTDDAGLGAGLRRTYRTVLSLCCVYYYLSIPLVLVSVVGLAAALFMGMWAVGYIPIKLAAIVGVLAIVSVGAIVKSIFTRPVDADPGVRLDTSGHPRFAAVLAEVAREIGTAPVDSVYLTPGTDLAVFERGSMLRQLRGAGERCLILGVGALEGLKTGPFKAVLAHEYGHLSNRDTAGGGFALAVRRSILQMAEGLARGGAAGWFNPAWLFVNAFYRIFLRISQGASRLQEVLADRWSALAYGAERFEQGLRHLIGRSVAFDVGADATIREAVEGRATLVNLYAPLAGPPAAAAEIEKAVAAALEAEPSPYDSHPSPSQRFAWVRGIRTTPTGRLEDADEPAWSLFSDRAALELLMTEEVRRRIRAAHGIDLPGAPAPAPAT